MGYNKYENLENKMCRELEMLEEKHKASSGDMTVQDLEKIDKLAHALKSLATYRAMKAAEEDGEGEFDGYSGRRGRAANGRYTSRESSGRSYEDGYSEGYSEAMSQAMNMGNSGHYPMPPYPTRRY